MHPNGPEPASVYWVRRAAILVVLLTVVVGAWWLLGALSGSGADPAADSTGTGTEVVVDDTAGVDSGGVDSSGTESGGVDSGGTATSAVTTPAEPLACADSVIAVAATTDASTYRVGEKPRLMLSITNTGEVACTRDVGPKANELEITSGGYHVWSSDDCNASDKTKVTLLEPGQTVASTITWSGRLTQKGCPGGEGAKAKAGRYDVEGRNGKVRSEQTPFGLSNRN
jgi:hypothetical protein